MLPLDKTDPGRFDEMKSKYRGELIPSWWPPRDPQTQSLVDFFQFTREGIPTGVVRLDLGPWNCEDDLQG